MSVPIFCLNVENLGDNSNPNGEKLFWRCCAIQLSHIISFTPHIKSARGENTVKGRMHQAIKEMILLRPFVMGRMLINEESLKEKEKGLGFYKAR